MPGSKSAAISGYASSAILHAATLVVLGSVFLPNARELSAPPRLEAGSAEEPSPAELAGLDWADETTPIDGPPLMVAMAAPREPYCEEATISVGDLLPQYVQRRSGGEVERVLSQLRAAKATGSVVRFFGSAAYGDRLVFVLDMSGSMAEDRRFQRAAEELLSTIDGLEEEQWFQVVLFHTYCRPFVADRSAATELLQATYANKRRLRAWLPTVRPSGWSDPRPALQWAMELEPTAIFVLSDGEFKTEPKDRKSGDQKLGAATLRLLSRHGRSSTPIHTIAFEDAANARILRVMSERSGGSYRYVPPERTPR